MSRSKYTNYNDLPLMLSVPDVASVIGISRAGAYELVRSDSFPSLRIGPRIIVPKERFIEWINANTKATRFTLRSDGRLLIYGLEDDAYTITELKTDGAYTLLKDGIGLVISIGESSTVCDIYGSDVLGLIQNDPRYADIEEGLFHNMPQKHLEHKLLTASAKVDNKQVTLGSDNGSANAFVPLTVVNTKGFDLPKTGGYGNWMFPAVGLSLVAVAVVVIYFAFRDKKKETNMAGIFADEGITGTSARKRPEFLRMIRQCKQGKIDIVLTKSISRFARNTVDCLNYVRVLKELGIAVIFEKENMNTLEIDSEILITMLGAFAQSESESISANVRWGIRQAMKEGKATIQYKYLYGYRKGDDGKPEIIPDQAEVVRKIYDLFLSGTPVRGIQEYLNTSALPNINGEPKWARSAIDSILTNEKYCGDVLLQKTYIDDCINKKVKKNTGQLPMYLVQNHHEGIISHETFDAAQAELARRSAGRSPSKKNAPTGRSRYSSKYALSDRLYCGECGTRYQRCTWRNRDGSKRIVWRCVSRVDYGNKYCHDSPTLDEEPLHRAILAAINNAVEDKDNIVYNLKAAMEKELAPVAGQQLSLSEIDNQLEQLNTEFSKVLAEASECGDQAAYSDRFRDIMQKQTALKSQRDEIQGMLAESGKAAAHIEQCRQAAETTPSAIAEWDEALIRQVVESVTVETGNEIIVALKSGTSIHQELM